MSKQAMEDGSYVAMDKCYYCGQNKHILLHTRFKDISELNGKVIDKVPCTECEEYMQHGIILISVRDGDTNTDNPYRTGGWWVMKQEACERIFSKANIDFNKQRAIFLEDKVCDAIGLQKPQPNEQHDNLG